MAYSPANISNRLWNAQDIAHHYGISVGTVYKRRIYHPSLLPPALKLGKRVSWIPSKVAEWDAQHVGKESVN